jgi:Zn-dependent protease with chaperone function
MISPRVTVMHIQMRSSSLIFTLSAIIDSEMNNVQLPWLVVGIVAFGGLITFLLMSRRASYWILRRIGARPVPPQPVWNQVKRLSEDLAYKYRITKPRLYYLPEYTPNAMVLRDAFGSPVVVLTEGLLTALNSEELEAILALAMALVRTRGFRRSVVLALFLHPWVSLLNALPKPFWYVFAPLVTLLVRSVYRRNRIFHSDRAVVRSTPRGRALIAALQKISVLSRKLPMRNWSLAHDHLFVVSPLVGENFPFPFFFAQPKVSERIDRMYELA